jgi:hypothetical protein
MAISRSQNGTERRRNRILGSRDQPVRTSSLCDSASSWIVDLTFASTSRNHRLIRNFDHYTRTVAAFVRLAMTRMVSFGLLAQLHKLKSNHFKFALKYSSIALAMVEPVIRPSTIHVGPSIFFLTVKNVTLKSNYPCKTSNS